MSMTDRNRLEAAAGLVLSCPEASPWRLAWTEADWLGPIGLRAHCGGTRYAASADVSDSKALVQERREQFEGADDIGAFSGVRIHWHDLPLPLSFSARAYREQPLIVFRIEAHGDVPAQI